ncbi:MAG: MATE family efflux transporter [delta proteobacterium ML8_F1]|nr:MAG: MATE family efflux transporter [delta proteobacterium ML8_F1]
MNSHSTLLGQEDIRKLLVRLSTPATIAMIVNALYNLIDTIFVGRGVGYLGIAGLSVAFPIQMIIMAFGMMVGIGAASSVSRNLGAGNLERAEKVAGNSYTLILIIIVLISTFGLLFTDPILRLFGATETILPYARDYIRIIFLGSIFFSFAVSSNNLIRAEGNARVAMYAMIIGTGLNILLDPLFIFTLDMGIQGAALATILAQFISFVYILVYLKSGKSSLKIALHHLRPEVSIVREILGVGLPTFVRQINGSLLAIIMNNTLGFYGGDIAITVYGIINRVMMFLLMPMFGVVQGMQPIVGFNYGARKFDRVKETLKYSLVTVTGFALFGWILSRLFPRFILGIFTTEAAVIDLGMTAIHYIFLAIPIIGIQIISGALFQALGKSKPAFILSILRQMLILIPLVLILPLLGFGLLGVFIAFPVSDVISTAISALILKQEVDKMHL